MKRKRYRIFNMTTDRAVYVNGLQTAKTTAKLQAASIKNWPSLSWHPDEGRKVWYLWQGPEILATVRPWEEE